MMSDATISTERLTVHCAGNGLDYAAVIAWESDPIECPRCGQMIAKDGPPAMLDGGLGSWVEARTWGHQHGCGEWVAPVWACSEPVRIEDFDRATAEREARSKLPA